MDFNTYLAKKKPDDNHYMTVALKAARQAKFNGDVPVGASLVWPAGHIVESDTSYTEHDKTNHAVMNVIRKAVQMIKSDLHDSTLYCTVEPCAMCAFAAAQNGVKEIIFGAYDLKNGVVSTKVHEHLSDVVFKGGVLSEQCVEILSKSLQEYVVPEVNNG